MSLQEHIQIAGGLQILLALAHVEFARRFGWRDELKRLSLLNRQIFYVHAFFLCLVLVLFGLLDICFADDLVARGKLAGAILTGITVFWFTRWLFQFFVYDSSLWRAHRFNTIMHGFFTSLWAYFAGIHGWALWNQLIR